jgi:hypothetical protein
MLNALRFFRHVNVSRSNSFGGHLWMATLSAIEQAGTRLFNPLRVCEWNLNKVYLRDLQQRGVTIAPTQWMAACVKTKSTEPGGLRPAVHSKPALRDSFGCVRV